MALPINIHTHRTSATETTIRTVGIHPYDAASATQAMLAKVEQDATEADAIGEIGLDFACDAPREKQMEVFCAQLGIAERLQKPVVLHCVRSFEPIMEALGRVNVPAVIFHGFIGSPEQAARAVERGYFLSFGERTQRSPKSVEALRSITLDRIFVETDESTMAIEQIYTEIAQLIGITAMELMRRTRENFERIFRTK